MFVCIGLIMFTRFITIYLLTNSYRSHVITHTKPDMGLGKTLQSVTLIHTLLKTGIAARAAPTAKRVIVVCPCSLVKNWDNEFVKWLGPGVVKTIALAESDRKTVEKNLDVFVRTKMFNVLIASYETMRTHIGRLTKHKDCCDLLGKSSLPYRYKPWWSALYSSFASTHQFLYQHHHHISFCSL